MKVLTGNGKLRGWRWWLYRFRQIQISPYSLKATILVKLKFYPGRAWEVRALVVLLGSVSAGP